MLDPLVPRQGLLDDLSDQARERRCGAARRDGDQNVSGQVIDTLGHQSNFMAPPENCMYAELGISIAQANNPTPANILVSLSCQQVQAFNFQWPYQQTGLTPDTEKKFVTIAQQVFAGH